MKRKTRCAFQLPHVHKRFNFTAWPRDVTQHAAQTDSVEVELIKNRLHYLSNRNHSCYSCFWFCGSYLFLSKSDTCLLLLLFYIYIYTHCNSVFHPSLSCPFANLTRFWWFPTHPELLYLKKKASWPSISSGCLWSQPKFLFPLCFFFFYFYFL